MSVGESGGTGFARECALVRAAPLSSAGARGAVSASRRDAGSGRNMTRRNRLSRSRDFDAVYRNGGSAASRYLVAYSFRPTAEHGAGARNDARLGLAVPRQVGDAVTRNRVKRRLRAAFSAASERLEPEHDYVLIARPGLAEAVENQGFAWLAERVEEALAGAASADRDRAA